MLSSYRDRLSLYLCMPLSMYRVLPTPFPPSNLKTARLFSCLRVVCATYFRCDDVKSSILDLDWTQAMLPFYNPPFPNQQQQQPQSQQMNGFYQNPAYSSHYLQAYMQSQPGYYQQQQYQPTPPQYPNVPGPSNPRPRLVQPTGQWYQPGNKRCTYKDCTFTGSHSSVEIHMMDRHLIFPPGWEKRPKKTEWDADPSLKGYARPFHFICDTLAHGSPIL